jgi:hypothetical protein
MRLFIGSLLLFCLVFPASAATINVGPTRAITTIQGGIDAASAGDTVRIDAGTYAADFTNTKSRLRIVGVSRDTVIVNGEGTFTAATTCTLQNMTINGTNLALDIDSDSHGNRLFNLLLTTSDPSGIGIVVSGNRNSILKCTVSGGDVGVEVNGSWNILFSCQVSSNAGDAFDIGGEGNTVRKCTAISAGDDGFDIGGSGSVILKCVAAGSSAAGFCLGTDGSTVSRCIGISNAESGMTLEGDGNVVTRCRFGTVLTPNTGPGIIFGGADANFVTHCAIVGNSNAGMTLGDAGNARDNVIERNAILSNNGAGMLITTNNNANDNWV